jgi:hypothetical protein
MAVALAENALLNPADAQVAKFLKLPPNSDDLITLINRASADCEGYCNRPLKAQTFMAVRLAGHTGRRLRPLATPIDVAGAITLSLDARSLTVWKSEADGDPLGKEVIVGGEVPGAPSFFDRAAGWVGATPFPVLASFTGGLDPIPDDLQQAALLVCQTMQRQEKGQTEVQAYGPGPVSQSVSFRADSLIPMWSKQVLDRWRVVPIG